MKTTDLADPRVRRMPRDLRHESAHCRDGKRCQGPGCNLSTGKTARKRGQKRGR